MNFLSVKNLTKYQHYKHRNPPWIKLYREVWTDYTLRQQSVTERLLFLGLSSLAMELDNHVPSDPKYLSDRLGFKITEKDIYNLISSNLILSNLEEHVGGLHASNMLAPNASNMLAETNGRDYKEESKEVLAFLNLKAQKEFREVEANLAFIDARLQSGVDVQSCKTLIARKVRDWGTDPKMAKYLRPETLFNKTKFETYLAEVSS